MEDLPSPGDMEVDVEETWTRTPPWLEEGGKAPVFDVNFGVGIIP